MKGKTISHQSLTPTILQLLLSRDGVTLMKDVERSTKTYIFYDRYNLNVKVFGPHNGVADAEEKLVQSLLSFHENRPLDIRLRDRSLPPDLMKEVVQSTSLAIQPSEATCPICLCELEDPYRLEECGHSFCRNCLIEQCESAIRSHDGFPLCCTKERCGEPLLLVDLRSLLSCDKLEELFRASLGAFVGSSGGAYRFCPTPDCPSVYKVCPRDGEPGRPFVCGACGVETCTKCHMEFHPSVSCERYREFKVDPDLSLEEWREGKDFVKDCPSCGHTIEKAEGCNHVECLCGKHLCWVCLESFDCSDSCYDHLRSVHHAIM
ncbi:putative uncharacterized protein, chloroplastic [Ananas comosus]|uniref:Uncharacterized protein n=1 Tax=Ananas comosus TaxID=4615 RepID=A0A199UJV2_ANACO|nr:putative uncharacterized protein, chloroplastic [Ananas comosus]